MKLRLSLILASFVSTLVLLFAVWFVYVTWFVERPVENKLATIKGVGEVHLETSREQVRVELALTEDAELKSVHETALAILKPIAKKRQLTIQFRDHPSQPMQEAWQKTQFLVEEALSRHEYRKLPEVAESFKEQLQLDQAIVDINAGYVYFQFKKGEYRLYKVYPRRAGEEEIHG
ncbi:MAG: hypothetical protein BAA01_02610 [Bacillus thermozeamaize]|uniref:Uncharacterized protein n=1 Tax=Bacillus thermozeamaize TaxID=230954 RepID=A0A1Y3PRM5_9BACI|nr:MAG: hypothetical protein BAA01_02610 [Bacillus thermozeamaize]